MNKKELEFLGCLLRSTSSENIVVVDEDIEEGENTLASYFSIAGKHASNNVVAGIYVYESPNWQIYGDFEPSKVYILAESDNQVFYFSPNFD